MAGHTYLKVALTLMALYAGVMAAMAVMFQDAGSFVFQYSIKDPVVLRYWGGVLFALAIFYLFISYDPEKYRMFMWIGVLDLGVAMIITVMNVAQHAIAWYQGVVALILNPIFIVILLAGLAKKPEGEVVFRAGEVRKGKPEEELPPHITGHHPLHGK